MVKFFAINGVIQLVQKVIISYEHGATKIGEMMRLSIFIIPSVHVATLLYPLLVPEKKRFTMCILLQQDTAYGPTYIGKYLIRTFSVYRRV